MTTNDTQHCRTHVYDSCSPICQQTCRCGHLNANHDTSGFCYDCHDWCTKLPAPNDTHLLDYGHAITTCTHEECAGADCCRFMDHYKLRHDAECFNESGKGAICRECVRAGKASPVKHNFDELVSAMSPGAQQRAADRAADMLAKIDDQCFLCVDNQHVSHSPLTGYACVGSVFDADAQFVKFCQCPWRPESSSRTVGSFTPERNVSDLCARCGKGDGENGQHDYHHRFVRVAPDKPLTAEERERLIEHLCSCAHGAPLGVGSNHAAWCRAQLGLRLLAQVEALERDLKECNGQPYSSNPREQSHAFQIEHALKKISELTAAKEQAEKARDIAIANRDGLATEWAKITAALPPPTPPPSGTADPNDPAVIGSLADYVLLRIAELTQENERMLGLLRPCRFCKTIKQVCDERPASPFGSQCCRHCEHAP